MTKQERLRQTLQKFNPSFLKQVPLGLNEDGETEHQC